MVLHKYFGNWKLYDLTHIVESSIKHRKPRMTIFRDTENIEHKTHNTDKQNKKKHNTEN